MKKFILTVISLLIFLGISIGLIAYVEKVRSVDKMITLKDLNASLPKQAKLVSHEDGPLFQSFIYSLPKETDTFKIIQSYCAFFGKNERWREILKKPIQNRNADKCSLLTKESTNTQHLIFCMGSRNRLEVSIATDKNSLEQGGFLKLLHNGRPDYPVPYCF